MSKEASIGIWREISSNGKFDTDESKKLSDLLGNMLDQNLVNPTAIFD